MPGVVVSVIVTTALQLSVAVNTAAAGTASHSTVALDGATLNTGRSLSITVTVNDLMVSLPVASFAVTVTVVVPIANNVFGFWLYVMVTPLQLSVALAANTTVAPHTLLSLLTLIFAGTVKLGALVSLTVITCVAVAVLLLGSVAVHTLVSV